MDPQVCLTIKDKNKVKVNQLLQFIVKAVQKTPWNTDVFQNALYCILKILFSIKNSNPFEFNIDKLSAKRSLSHIKPSVFP